MAVSLISYENKMNSGTLTVPAGTSMIVVLARNVTVPTLNGVSFSTAYIYTGYNLAIFYMNAPPIGTYSYTAGAYQLDMWCYLGGTNINGLLDTDYGSAVDATVSKTLTSKAGGLCFIAARGTEETVDLNTTVNGVSATSLATRKVASYGSSSGDTCVCTASDPSAGTPTIRAIFVSIDPLPDVANYSQAIWW